MRQNCFIVQHRRSAAALTAVLSTTSLIAFHGAAWAQAVKPEEYTLEELSVTGDGSAAIGYQPRRSSFGTGTDRPLLDTPANIAVVPQAVLRDQRVLSLDEALRNVSGIAQTNSLGGTQEGVVRRGFGTTRDSSIPGADDGPGFLVRSGFADGSGGSEPSATEIRPPAAVPCARGSPGRCPSWPRSPRGSRNPRNARRAGDPERRPRTAAPACP